MRGVGVDVCAHVHPKGRQLLVGAVRLRLRLGL